MLPVVFENIDILHMSIYIYTRLYTYIHYDLMIVTCVLLSCVTSCVSVVYANYKIACIPCSQFAIGILQG